MKRAWKNLKFSLRLKIAGFFLLLVILMMAAVGYVFTIRELNLRKEQIKVRIERLANNIAAIRSVETEDWNLYQTYIDNQIVVNPDIVYIAIFDERGQLRIHSLNRSWLELESGRPLSREDVSSIVLRLDQRQIAAESQRDFETQSVNIMVGDKSLGTVNIGFSLVEINDEMKQNVYRNLQMDFVFVVIAMIIALVVSSRIVNPLSQLTRAMEKISQGDLAQTLQIASHDEIGEMATTFNYMSRGLQEKQIIENFTRELGFTFELDKIVHLITQQIPSALKATHGLFFLTRSNHDPLFDCVSRYPDRSEQEVRLQLEPPLIEALLLAPYPQPLKKFSQHHSFVDQLAVIGEPPDEALICPIVIKNKLKGIFLICCSPLGGSYSEEEIQFLKTLLYQGSVAIENALLYTELTEQERLKSELEIARRVQLGLLPQVNPQMAGLDLDGVCIPAAEIGGDYYDYFRIDEHTLGIAIADVAGKGTSAAFYMAVIKGIMLSLTMITPSPKTLLRELNQRVLGTLDRRIFATMIYAVIDSRKRRLTFARAGHNALIKRDGHSGLVESLTPKGLGLGLAEDGPFQQGISEQTVPFQPGDVFVFYTDGISEAMNDQQQEFGEAKLAALLAQSADLSARDFNHKVLQEINRFARNAPQHDDLTLVTVKALERKPMR